MRYQNASKVDVEYILGILGTIYPISKELKKAFVKKTKSLNVHKNTVLLKSGEHCQYMYFIKSGAIMGETTHKKKKIVTYISVENEFVSSITGLHGVVPSQEAIIAVEDSKLLAMHNTDLQELFLQYFDMNYLFRVMVEKYYRDAQERSHIIRVGNAMERYRYFVDTKPGYIERLPLQLIASMLDMKLATLLKVQKQYELSLKSDKETELWCKKIEACILQQEAYRKPNITLVSMAALLSISPQKLSVIINNTYQLSFVEYINKHRINSIVIQMSNPGMWKNYTIEALAKNAGFVSRSAFYNAFKRWVGNSPAQYVKSIGY